MNSAQATGGLTARVPSAAEGVVEWFWRGRALQEVQASPAVTPERREHLRRARLATELADRTIDPAEPLRDGSALPLAISLYREAAYWALLAASEGRGYAGYAGGRSESGASASAPAAPVDAEASATAAGTVAEETEPHADLSALFDAYNSLASGLKAEDLAIVRKALAGNSFVSTAAEPLKALSRQAELSQAFVHGLLESQRDIEDHVALLQVQRFVRSGALLLALLLVAVSAYTRISRALQGPDLALNKPWRTSSTEFVCHPKESECGGAHTAIFFHTKEEREPWWEVDLGKPHKVGRVEIVNRDDCCVERAAPLVVEVAGDDHKWREVARQKETFRTWEAHFKPVKARFVRLRLAKRGTLHLAQVTVRAK